MLGLKKWYINFVEKKTRNPLELILYGIFYILSLAYGLVIQTRNFLYDINALFVYAPQVGVVSIGNLSWGGCGKTTLAIWLYKKLAPDYTTAILRRGYGNDEEKLLKTVTPHVFSDSDRLGLARKLQTDYNLFILDDGFQYRKLARDVNILIMGAREFEYPWHLIPASFFRESLTAAKRADIVIVNYADTLADPQAARAVIKKYAPQAGLYFARYACKGFIDLNGLKYSCETFKNKRLAALCAIGYPQGFFGKLSELKLNVVKQIVYPDHYQLSKEEFKRTLQGLRTQNVNDLITTAKDLYHLPQGEYDCNLFVMEIEMIIEKENDFLNEIRSRLKKR